MGTDRIQSNVMRKAAMIIFIKRESLNNRRQENQQQYEERPSNRRCCAGQRYFYQSQSEFGEQRLFTTLARWRPRESAPETSPDHQAGRGGNQARFAQRSLAGAERGLALRSTGVGRKTSWAM